MDRIISTKQQYIELSLANRLGTSRQSINQAGHRKECNDRVELLDQPSQQLVVASACRRFGSVVSVATTVVFTACNVRAKKSWRLRWSC
jgi:hypothetical protein